MARGAWWATVHRVAMIGHAWATSSTFTMGKLKRECYCLPVTAKEYTILPRKELRPPKFIHQGWEIKQLFVSSFRDWRKLLALNISQNQPGKWQEHSMYQWFIRILHSLGKVPEINHASVTLCKAKFYNSNSRGEENFSSKSGNK